MTRTIQYGILTVALAISATGCGKPEAEGRIKDWDNISDYCYTGDSKSFDTYYKPYAGNVGDPMPFFDVKANEFKVLYLQDFESNREGTYHPFWGVSTTDCASYASMGEVLSCGGIDEQDAALGTGCAVYDEKNALYYIYYTGNKYLPDYSESGQIVMRAVSEDFKTWTKDKSFYIKGETHGYSKDDFRDPCIFADDNGLWHMLIATVKDGKGVLAEYTSSDLGSWEHKGVFMSMMWDRFYECPDVFKMGEWWYLVYSEKHPVLRKTQYFKASDLEGLKECTENDAAQWPDGNEGVLDARAFYAGKTASDGNERYIWGWCPARPGKDNTNVGAYPKEPAWGGALVCHRLVQDENGCLFCEPAPGIMAKYVKNSEIKVMEGESYTTGQDEYSLSGDAYVLFNRLSQNSCISFKIEASSPEDVFGFSFARGGDSEKYYSFVFESEEEGKYRRIQFEEKGKEGIGRIYGMESNKFAQPEDNVFDVTILTDNSVCVIYVNGCIAYTNRIHGLRKNCWSADCHSGNITLSSLSINHIQ